MQNKSHTENITGKWGIRFWAYFVDVLIVCSVVGAFLGAEFTVLQQDEESPYMLTTSWALTSSAFFAYFTILERLVGYTVGKRIFGLRVQDATGNKPTTKMLLISNFGKAYVMPLDAIIGMIAFKGARQRAFAKIAGIATVKMPLAK